MARVIVFGRVVAGLALAAVGTVSAREVVAGGHYCCSIDHAAVTQMEEVETKAPTPASQPASQAGNNTCQGDDDEAAARARPGTTGTAMRVGTLASLEEKCMPCRPPWEKRPELKQAETMRQAGDRCRDRRSPGPGPQRRQQGGLNSSPEMAKIQKLWPVAVAVGVNMPLHAPCTARSSTVVWFLQLAVTWTAALHARPDRGKITDGTKFNLWFQ